MVEVVHMRNFGRKSKALSEKEVYVYAGRPSRLGNPYSMKNQSDAERYRVIEAFRNDENAKKVVAELKKWFEASQYEHLKLGCFCKPKACHCDVIKEWIEE